MILFAYMPLDAFRDKKDEVDVSGKMRLLPIVSFWII